MFLSKQIFPSALDPKPWAVTLRRNVRVNFINRNEMDVAIYHPDLFLRVNKAEQHGLGQEPGLFEENLGNKLEKKSPFFYLNVLSH